jgi:hypothetical protein
MRLKSKFPFIEELSFGAKRSILEQGHARPKPKLSSRSPLADLSTGASCQASLLSYSEGYAASNDIFCVVVDQQKPVSSGK